MAAEVWADAFVDRLSGAAPLVQAASYLGQHFVVVEAAHLTALLVCLKEQETFETLLDLTAVDYPQRSQRFELVYTLYSFHRNERLRVKTRTADAVPSIVSLHAGANWLEREVYDMFGISFEGHPDLRRMLLPEEWQGFPLRKEHGITEMDNQWVRENLGIASGQ